MISKDFYYFYLWRNKCTLCFFVKWQQFQILWDAIMPLGSAFVFIHIIRTQGHPRVLRFHMPLMNWIVLSNSLFYDKNVWYRNTRRVIVIELISNHCILLYIVCKSMLLTQLQQNQYCLQNFSKFISSFSIKSGRMLCIFSWKYSREESFDIEGKCKNFNMKLMYGCKKTRIIIYETYV